MWSGAIVDIPAGWQICDGTNGTPDLRNRFVVGAGDSFDPDDTGGATTHDHDFTSDGHTHGVEAGVLFDNVAPDTAWGSQVDTGTTDADNHLPPYYALAFIQKM